MGIYEKRIKVAIISIVSSLAEIEDHSGLDTLCYMALNGFDSEIYTLDAYMRIIALLEEMDLLKKRNGRITLTERGIKFGDELNSITVSSNG